MTRSDFTNDPIKNDVRLTHIATAIKIPLLFDVPQARFRCDWLELSGTGAPTAAELFKHKLIQAPQRFIGWDLNGEVVAGCENTYADDIREGRAVFRAGNLNDNLEGKEHEDVGVLVWDATETADTNFQNHVFPGLAQFARRQRERLGGFLLVLQFSYPGFDPDAVYGWLKSLGVELGRHFGGSAVPPEKFFRYVGDTSVIPMRGIRIRL